MIRFTTGNILEAEAEALVNTVNCVGIMGRGIALQFKIAFPDNFKAYKQACDQGEVMPGRMLVFDTGYLGSPKFIINFPTKRHWRGKSRIEDIASGLQALRKEISSRNIRSIAIPPLGSGLGGLDWRAVRPMITAALSDMDIQATIFEPGEAPAKIVARNAPEMRPGRAALVVLMHRYLGGLLDPFVTLLELHKLLYFMQEAGQGLKLRFKKGHYGPYAENLRHVLTEIEGYFISGYRDGGDDPEKRLEIVPGAVADAEKFLEGDDHTRERFDRVAALVEGFETPRGLELLATVHWVVKQEGASNAEEALRLVHAWNEGKKQFTRHQVELAFRTLSDRGWLVH